MTASVAPASRPISGTTASEPTSRHDLPAPLSWTVATAHDAADRWRRWSGARRQQLALPAGDTKRPLDLMAGGDQKPKRSLHDSVLLARLERQASGLHAVGYQQARELVFSVLDNDGGDVRCVYTGRVIETQHAPDPDGALGMNVEHTWPKSKGLVGTPGKSDLHHLFPTDTKTNNIRGQHPFGVVVDPEWEESGAKRGKDASGRIVFEPPDEHKGVVARAMFYVSMLYGLPLDDAEEAVLRLWHDATPVDNDERRRNDVVAGIQGNKNPFIERPELVGRVHDF